MLIQHSQNPSSSSQQHTNTLKDRQTDSQSKAVIKRIHTKKKDTRTNSTKKLMNIKYKTKERKEAV